MRDVLRLAQHILAMDAFANESTLTFLKAYCGENVRVVDNKYQPRIGETVEIIYDPNSGAEAMRIGYGFLKQGKRVAFVSTGAVMARALVERASKLTKPDNSPIKARAYYGDMDGKQRQEDFSDINTVWGELDCIAYTNTVEAGRENIRAELASARPNEVPTAIKGHREWDKDIVSYKLDDSPAVVAFIEVEHQKRLSARNFIEKFCSLIASTGANLQLIKIDEGQGIIGNRKKIRNWVRAKALDIKETDFSAIATARNLSPEEAEFLKLDQERSVEDTMALKRFYIWSLYGGKDMSIDDWNKLCDKEFVEHFGLPEPRKHFLRLSQFRRQGYDEESAI
ncbi:hypothetical protein C2G38_2129143, partial [Gigaspora rosea]